MGAAARAEWCARFESDLNNCTGEVSNSCLQAADLLVGITVQRGRAGESFINDSSSVSCEQQRTVHDTPPNASDDVARVPANVDLDTISGLLYLHDCGQKVLWPQGVDLLLARRWVSQ